MKSDKLARTAAISNLAMIVPTWLFFVFLNVRLRQAIVILMPHLSAAVVNTTMTNIKLKAALLVLISVYQLRLTVEQSFEAGTFYYFATYTRTAEAVAIFYLLFACVPRA